MTYQDTRRMWKSLLPFKDDDLPQCLYDFHRQNAYAECRRLFEDTPVSEVCATYNGQDSDNIGEDDAYRFVQGIRAADEFLLPLVIKKKPLAMDTILHLHALLTETLHPPNSIGVFRPDIAYQYGEKLGDPEAALYGAISKCNKVLCTPGHHALRAGVVFYSRFLTILPFSYGNSIMGRFLLNYVLLLQDEPPVTLLPKDMRNLNHALRLSHHSKDVGLLMEYMRDATVRTWEHSALTCSWQNQEGPAV